MPRYGERLGALVLWSPACNFGFQEILSEEMGERQASHKTAMLIEYCLNNVDARTREMLRAVRGFEVREHPCLGRCGECYAGPLLVADGEPVAGSDHRGILARLSSEKGSRRYS